MARVSDADVPFWRDDSRYIGSSKGRRVTCATPNSGDSDRGSALGLFLGFALFLNFRLPMRPSSAVLRRRSYCRINRLFKPIPAVGPKLDLIVSLRPFHRFPAHAIAPLSVSEL